MNSKKSLIIAIAAVSGGGKTTVTNQLKDKLSRTKALFFDNYDFIGPDDICDWVVRGADYNEWDLAPLINDLCTILSDTQNSVDYILLDYPFAYKHSEMSEFIDFTVFIDTPLDIALARRILRDNKESTVGDVQNEMSNYLSRGRDAYLEMLKTVKPNSDYIVNGLLPVDEIVNQIFERINELCK